MKSKLYLRYTTDRSIACKETKCSFGIFQHVYAVVYTKLCVLSASGRYIQYLGEHVMACVELKSIPHVMCMAFF
jgi:hypothetical protein